MMAYVHHVIIAQSGERPDLAQKKQEITVKTREVKKHVSSNQAHVVSSNQPIQKRFNVANPGLTKPGFSGDSADLLDDQRVLLSKFFVIGPKNHPIYIYYISYIQ
jgi:hypothetical protein